MYSKEELFKESLEILHKLEFDIRAVTLGLNINNIPASNIKEFTENLRIKIKAYATLLSEAVDKVQKRYNVEIANRRIAVTPIGVVAARFPDINKDGFKKIAKAMDEGIKNTRVDIIGGFSILAHKGLTRVEEEMLNSLPKVLKETEAVCASINVATTKTGINMEAIKKCAKIILEIAEATKDKNSFGCAKFVVFSNMPEDNPFMAGAIHGLGEPDASINVGISGPGVIREFIKRAKERGYINSYDDLERVIKRGVAKITAIGDLIGREVEKEMNFIKRKRKRKRKNLDNNYQWLKKELEEEVVSLGIVDLSLAPTIRKGDSVAEILKEMGVSYVGGPGTTAALAMLIDAVKKGGVSTATFPGGLSGTFIPVSEDAIMAEAAGKGYLSLDKLEAMTAVCSVGMDMFAISGNISEDILAGLIADEIAIGVVNNKATAVRVIPVKNPVYKFEKKNGDFLIPTSKVVFWLEPKWTLKVEKVENGNKYTSNELTINENNNNNIIKLVFNTEGHTEEYTVNKTSLESFMKEKGMQEAIFAYYDPEEEKTNLWGEAYIMKIPLEELEEFKNSGALKNLEVPFTTKYKGRISAPIKGLTN